LRQLRQSDPRQKPPACAGNTGAVADAVGVEGARPYDLRHAFASLLIHEGRLSVVDIASQLGHNPTVCLDTYAHVMAEQRGAVPVSAEEQILLSRREHGVNPVAARSQLSLFD